MTSSSTHLSLARHVSDLFSRLPQVGAIALGGSTIKGVTDYSSDIDLYVYTHEEIPLNDRQVIVNLSGGATQANLGLDYWGPGDEWFNLPTGIEVDIIYFDTRWMENQIQLVIDEHRASLGYTTCMWHIVRNSLILHDPRGWFNSLQEKGQAKYPDALRNNILTINYPVLRTVIPAYFHQLEKAVKRFDLVSINHRLAALLASYFDIIFALNRELHPGEKKLIQQASKLCERLPVDMASDITSVIQTSSNADQDFLLKLTQLLDHLDRWLEGEGFSSLVTKFIKS